MLLGITFFLSPDFHELWHSMMSTCLFTEVKWQWAMFSTAGWLTASVHYSCLGWLVDQNPFELV